MSVSPFFSLLRVCVLCVCLVSVLGGECPPEPTLAWRADAWVGCAAPLDSFQCRNATFPRLWNTTTSSNAPTPTPTPTDPKQVGELTTLQRRLLKGTPQHVVFLFSGGPGGSSDLLALTCVNRFAAALGDNYAIYVPALRGTLWTDQISGWADFPANFSARMADSPLPWQAYSYTHTARDMLHTVRAAKLEFPNAAFHAAGFSFGTLMIQRLLVLDPSLFANVILDGPVTPQYTTSPNINQQTNFAALSKNMADNCARDPFCSTYSLSYDQLTAFVNSLAAGVTNPCMTALVNVFAPGTPASYHHQLFYSLTASLAMVSNVEVTPQLYQADPTLPSVRQQFQQAAFTTWRGDYGVKGNIYLEFRAVMWSLMNQVAKCPTTNSSATTPPESFLAYLKTFSQLLNTLGNVNQYFLSPSSPMGNSYVTQILNLRSEFSLNYSAAAVRQAQSSGPLRSAESSFQAEDTLLAQSYPFQPTVRECSSNKTVTNAQANVLFLLGRLDPNVPIALSLQVFQTLTVAEGFTKSYRIHENAGHTVISLGWSKCCASLIRSHFLKDQAALNEYLTCVANENSKTVDWALSTFNQTLGINFWGGIQPNPTAASSSSSSSSTGGGGSSGAATLMPSIQIILMAMMSMMLLVAHSY